MCSSRRRLAAIVLALLGAAAIGCGHKERPQPPPQRIPDRVQDLRVTQRGGQLELTFTYPQTTISGLPIDDIVAIELWQFEMPVPDFAVGGASDGSGSETEPAEGDESGEEDQADADGDPSETGAAAADDDRGTDAAPEIQDEPTVEEDDPEPEPTAPEATDEAETGQDEVDAEDEERGDDERTPATGKEALLEVDPRQFEASASKRLILEGTELSNAIRGDQVEIELTLDAIEPGEKEALIFGVKTFQTLKRASAFSNLARIIPRVTPEPPSDIELTSERNGVSVTWSFTGDEPEEFRVYRRDPRGSGFDVHHGTQDGDENRYLDSRAVLGSSYVYALTAVVNRTPLVESALSAEHEIEYVDAFPPDPPTELVVLSEVGAARLLWEASDADDLAGYVVHRRAEGGAYTPLFDTPIRGLEYLDSTAESGRIYSYRVIAVDRSGNQSDPSEEIQVRVP